ncbi:MAG TPA: hypothetical protein VF297_03150 [Pyrinomonadaceae bacterium]
MGYEDVFERLEAAGVRYVVVGGVAMTLHGHERPPRDLDLVVEKAPEEMRRATEAILSLGFVPTLPLPLGTLAVLRFTDASGREMDVFTNSRAHFEELWSGSELRASAGRPVRVCSLSYLIRMKRLNGRPQDFRDIETLLKGEGERAKESGK